MRYAVCTYILPRYCF